MIVCAAVKIRIKRTNREAIVYGLRHSDCFSVLRDVGLRPDDFEEIDEGFLKTDGSFLTRSEAFAHALECGQLSATDREQKRKANETELFSEDLY